MKKFYLVFLLLITTAVAQAGPSNPQANLQQDFDSLGDNAQLAQRAQLMDADNKVAMVQNRIVDRTDRLELGLQYGVNGSSESYFTTQNLGVNMDFHFTNYFSLGARYYHSYNSLTAEGQDVVNNAGQSFWSPQINYPTDTGLAVVTWYPFYGKLNFFNLGVTHFDFYALAGYGKTAWVSSTGNSSGLSDTIAAGGGVGFWLSQHFSLRLEGRYQTYSDVTSFGPQQENNIVGMASVGILL